MHGLGIDSPLEVYRADEGTDIERVFLHDDWRGTVALGSLEDGSKDRTSSEELPSAIDWSTHAVTTYGERFERINLDNAYRPFFGSLLSRQVDGSKLQYLRNRYYDPTTGRFTQEDPIGLAGGLNLYGFANGDPVNFSDPFGLCPSCKLMAGLFSHRARYVAGAEVGSPRARFAFDMIAAEQGRDLVVYSGDRDVQTNAQVGGSPNSPHLEGIAGDAYLDGLSHSESAGALLQSNVRRALGVRLIYHGPESTHSEHSHLDLREGQDLRETFPQLLPLGSISGIPLFMPVSNYVPLRDVERQ